ncbi:amino acid ABC transporter permease [Nesterenkonia sandarakina]|uniref:Amino acid ABC transporter membrane protein 1 (PAAT family) n=1 Tax=Nesterenkonia sandarakina TaxID=272918 RepID=A0A2T0YPZ8_9MICC|nr:amino acid ABC transporter permease [Nesterenkonia sandarakina]PRZ17486.1 amino acid ABC transporter membrane protein 1 (PAAT family) [Nesterenkonia sandarakina]
MDWLDQQQQNFESLQNFGPRLWDGFLLTVQLTLVGAALAFVIAVILGLMGGSPKWWLRTPARIIIEFFRGTSLLVQLFWVYYVLPLFGLTLESAFTVGVIALGLNYGAYGAEAVRASLTSVASGQWEATVALSMSWQHKIRRVIFPQAWALMIPSLANLLVHLMKGSAIVYIVGLNDFNFELDQLRRVTDAWFAYAFVGLIGYFTFALVLTQIMRLLEVRARHRLGQGLSMREILSPAPKLPTGIQPGGAS